MLKSKIKLIKKFEEINLSNEYEDLNNVVMTFYKEDFDWKVSQDFQDQAGTLFGSPLKNIMLCAKKKFIRAF